MHILFLSTWYPYPPDNGYKQRVYHLLRALTRNHEVTLVSFAFDDAQPNKQDDLHNWCRDVHFVPLNPFVVNRAGGLHTFLSLRPVASRPVPQMGRLVEQVIQSTAFDIYIASTEMMSEYVLAAGNGPIKIFEGHNSMTRWKQDRFQNAASPLQQARHWLGLQKRRRFESRYYPRFDLITMVSEDDRLLTLETVGTNAPPVVTIPNGVDVHLNRPGLAQVKSCGLVYNGSLTYIANYDAMRYFLAEIFPLIKREVPEAELTITGSTKGVDLNGLSLDGGVSLTGYVDDVRIPVAEAAVCVVPIRQGSGTRLKILEAMALGTPVVATSKAAQGLDIVDGENILLADDPVTFAACTVTLLHDPRRREFLAANARRLVEEQYDWNQIGQDFVTLVERTVANKNKQPW